MQALVKRIGGGGIAAILAVVLALSLIGYRFWQGGAEDSEVETALSADPLAELEQRSVDEPENVLVWQELGFFGHLASFKCTI